MFRQRMQVPEWAKDEILAEVDFAARLLFRDLHGIANKQGRLEDRPRWIKGEIFPYDEVTADDLVGLLDQLEARGYIRRYTVEGAKFIEIPRFLDTQKPHIREKPSPLPGPSEGAYTPIRHAQGQPKASPRQTRGKPKANPRRAEGGPRWPESESESVTKSESDSVPESDSKSETKTESARREHAPKPKTAGDEWLTDLIPQAMEAAGTNWDEEQLTDALMWLANDKKGNRVRKAEASRAIREFLKQPSAAPAARRAGGAA